MSIKIFFAILFSSITLSAVANTQSHTAQANDIQKYQAVCKAKTSGTEVSFAHKGVIWNGQCQSQFFPANKQASIPDAAQRRAICAESSELKSAQIDGQEVKGKCVMAYIPPQPIQ